LKTERDEFYAWSAIASTVSTLCYNLDMYDNTCKFLAETFPSDFASWLLGESIDLTQLSPSELSLEPIRADALILLASDEVILHIEFVRRESRISEARASP
jgi:predicted transposase YdaD